jgi:hypothetical protein
MVAQLLEIFKPRIKAKSEEAKRLLRIRELKNAMGQITTQAANATMNAETREMMGLDKDSLAHERAQQKKRQEIEMRFAAAVADDSQSAVERESFLMPYDSTFDDFNEMAIQFGYCTCSTFVPETYKPQFYGAHCLPAVLDFACCSGTFLAGLSIRRIPCFSKQYPGDQGRRCKAVLYDATPAMDGSG